MIAIQILCVITLVVAIFFLHRNNKVFSLRNRINYLCYDYGTKYNLPVDECYRAYYHLPSYEKMLCSTKPLKIESYVQPDLLQKLYS